MPINLIFLVIKLSIKCSDHLLFITHFEQLLVMNYLCCYQYLNFYFRIHVYKLCIADIFEHCVRASYVLETFKFDSSTLIRGSSFYFQFMLCSIERFLNNYVRL